MNATVQLTCDLIGRESVTPQDRGCQDMMIERLEALGFRCTSLPFNDTLNLWAEWGEDGPLFAFAGHTDVVPPGPLDAWSSPPFSATQQGEFLYGRGAADAKKVMEDLGYDAPDVTYKTHTIMGKTFDSEKADEYVSSFAIGKG